MKRLTALLLVAVMLFSCAAALADIEAAYKALIDYSSAADKLGASTIAVAADNEQSSASVIVDLSGSSVGIFGKQDGADALEAWLDVDFGTLVNYAIDLLDHFADFSASDPGFYIAITYGEGDDDHLIIGDAEMAAEVKEVLIGAGNSD